MAYSQLPHWIERLGRAAPAPFGCGGQSNGGSLRPKGEPRGRTERSVSMRQVIVVAAIVACLVAGLGAVLTSATGFGNVLARTSKRSKSVSKPWSGHSSERGLG